MINPAAGVIVARPATAPVNNPTNFGFFSNYSHKFYNVDIVYAGLLDMKINNFMSTQLTINMIYDEDQVKQTQFKQALGIGLTYKIDSTKKTDKKKRRKKEILPYFDISGVSPLNIPKFKINKQNYDRVFDKNTIDEKSTYIKSESILLE